MDPLEGGRGPPTGRHPRSPKTGGDRRRSAQLTAKRRGSGSSGVRGSGEGGHGGVGTALLNQSAAVFLIN